MKAVIAIMSASILLLGCATTSSVTTGAQGTIDQLHTVAFVPQGGSSVDVDNDIQRALLAQGVDIRATAPSGTRKMAGVDAVVSYEDVWRWDMVMYMKSIDIDVFDANTGSLLVAGHWENSPLHGYQDPAKVIGHVVTDMFHKMGWGHPAKYGVVTH